MEKFVVSARKYRPQNFNTVVGQEHITTTLKNAINHNQLAHAFLFCGPRGVGKTTCARILAKTINCTNKTPEGEACNVCNSCVSFDNGSSLNIHELDAASNNSVDDIRSLVEQVRFAPQAGDYKVYIVDEVHMLSSAAFNAFLKTLEEPPPYAIFILATTEKHKILPTILSRCQIFDFKRITSTDTVDHLQEICEKENITAEETALHIIAQKSEGCMRDALSILDKISSFTSGSITYANTLEHLNILDEDYFFQMLDHLYHQKLSDALLLFDDITQKGFEADTFLEGMMEFLRNLLVSTDPKVVSLLDVAEGFKSKYMQVAQEIPINWIISALNVLTETNTGYKQARNKKLFLELTLIKLSYMQQAMELSANGEGIEKKKLVEGSRSVAFKRLSYMGIKELPKKDKVVKGANKQDNSAVETHEATLTILQSKPTGKEIKPAVQNENISADILSEKSVLKTNEAAEETPSNIVAEVQPRGLGSLKKIQKEIAKKNQIEIPAEELTVEKLKVALHQVAQKLHSSGKDACASHIKNAKLNITDNDNFIFVVGNILAAKFIEGERAQIVEVVQDAFSNKKLKWTIEVKEDEIITSEPQEKQLNKKEQYRRMVEKYPLIQTLKENLNMGLS